MAVAINETIWAGPELRSIFKPDVSIGEILYEKMLTHSKNVCQVYNYQDLLNQIILFTKFILDYG